MREVNLRSPSFERAKHYAGSALEPPRRNLDCRDVASSCEGPDELACLRWSWLRTKQMRVMKT
jgi:hypothetical protein